MNKASTFAEGLHEFQHEVVEKWTTDYRFGQRIAISIQLHYQRQNRKFSCGAIESDNGPKAINSHCQEIINQATLLESCDFLDRYLKEKIADWNRGRGMSCRCHKGVSNFVLPFTSRNGSNANGRTDHWFIFFGQFLLKAPRDASHREIEEGMLQGAFDPLTDTQITARDKGILQTGVFVPETTCLETRFSQSNISVVEVPDFLAFKEYVVHEFGKFMQRIYSNEAMVKSLVNYYAEQNTKSLLRECSALEVHLNQRQDIVDPKRREILRVIDWMQSAAKHTQAALPEERIGDFISWLREGSQGGKIADADWLNRGSGLCS